MSDKVPNQPPLSELIRDFEGQEGEITLQEDFVRAKDLMNGLLGDTNTPKKILTELDARLDAILSDEMIDSHELRESKDRQTESTDLALLTWLEKVSVTRETKEDRKSKEKESTQEPQIDMLYSSASITSVDSLRKVAKTIEKTQKPKNFMEKIKDVFELFMNGKFMEALNMLLGGSELNIDSPKKKEVKKESGRLISEKLKNAKLSFTEKIVLGSAQFEADFAAYREGLSRSNIVATSVYPIPEGQPTTLNNVLMSRLGNNKKLVEKKKEEMVRAGLKLDFNKPIDGYVYLSAENMIVGITKKEVPVKQINTDIYRKDGNNETTANITDTPNNRIDFLMSQLETGDLIAIRSTNNNIKNTPSNMIGNMIGTSEYHSMFLTYLGNGKVLLPRNENGFGEETTLHDALSGYNQNFVVLDNPVQDDKINEIIRRLQEEIKDKEVEEGSVLEDSIRSLTSQLPALNKLSKNSVNSSTIIQNILSGHTNLIESNDSIKEVINSLQIRMTGSLSPYKKEKETS